MKLVTEQGELSLPSNFSFEVEQNSAFFSEEGAASIAATIPATPSDQAKLGFPGRIARKNRYVNSFPATIQKGIFQKKGELVVASATDDSITCSMALEDSSFYSVYKNKNLKELFSARVLQTYNTPSAWYSWLWQVYKCQVSSDFRVFPVAVAMDDDGNYQLNNEPLYDNATYDEIWPLAHSPRVVKEGSDDVSVPEGYGIAPFLKFPRFLELLFQLCGYTVGTNCFTSDSFLSNLVLVHNCSDVICNGKIDYSDLVPNKSISEFLEWLRMKFHAQIVVNPASKQVDIVFLEDIISAGYDLDLTKKLLGNATKQFSASSRVVMEPNTGLDGAAAAADTLDDLVKKYGYIKPCDESLFASILTPCLVLRLSTGDYYEVHLSFVNYGGRSPRSGGATTKKVKIGTNQFKYDRGNSDTSESFSPDDLVPPMVRVGHYGITAPYIGDRCHRNTSYNDSLKDEDQEIIIVYYAGLTEERPSYGNTDEHARVPITADGKYYMATTQKYNNRGNLISCAMSLIPEEMVPRFFGAYNKHLLNNAISVKGRFNLSIEDLMKYDMYKLKLFDGQTLLPVSLKYEVGKQIRCLEAEFKLIKDFADGQEDQPISVPEPIYQWQINQTQITAKKNELASQYTSGTVWWKYDETDPYVAEEKDIFLPSPNALGIQSPHILRQIQFIHRTSTPRTTTDTVIGVWGLEEWFDSVAIVI